MAGDGGVGGEMKRLGEMLEKMGRGRCRVAAVGSLRLFISWLYPYLLYKSCN